MHHQIHLGLRLHGAHAQQLLHVDDANAPQLDVVADELGRLAVELIRHPADVHRVVRHQPVAPLDELNGRLALAHAAVACDEHPLAVDVQQSAVAGDGGRQSLGEILDHLGGEQHRGVRRVKQRPLVLAGHGQALGVDVQVPGDHQGGDVVLEEPGETAGALLRVHALQHLGLRHADDLQAPVVKVVKKAHQLQAGAVHIFDAHQGRVKAAPLVHHSQI